MDVSSWKYPWRHFSSFILRWSFAGCTKIRRRLSSLHRSPDVHLVMVRSEKKYTVTVARTPIAPPKFYVIFFEPQRFLRRTPLLHQISWRCFFRIQLQHLQFSDEIEFFFWKPTFKTMLCGTFFWVFTTPMGPCFFGGEQKCCLKMDAWILFETWTLW